MCSEDGGGSECLDTVRALVRSLPAVNPGVFVKAGGLTETLPTQHALMWLVFLVYVQYVDAQTVLLLE